MYTAILCRTTMNDFLKEKQSRLNISDLSRKGFVDDYITHLIKIINGCEHFYTTSSCSGRIVLMSTPDDGSIVKKGCKWLLVTHDFVSLQEILEALAGHEGTAVLKYESFILHASCDGLESAQKLHSAGLESGFKNSGITISKKNRIIAAVRSSHCMEVPLSCDGKLLVDEKFLKFLVDQLNGKLKENFSRIQRFENCFEKLIENFAAETKKIEMKERLKKDKKNFQNSKTESVKSPDLITDEIEDCLYPEIFHDT